MKCYKCYNKHPVKTECLHEKSLKREVIQTKESEQIRITAQSIFIMNKNNDCKYFDTTDSI